MLHFCGQNKALIDANGRIKLSSKVLNDFENNGGFEIVLHYLPEGAIAVYPEAIYLKMRENESTPTEKTTSSVVYRRNLRRFGSFSRSERISAQGRITIPQGYRDFSGI
jgi:DNA-binding transcriptional regulator/RsmH inhibitor MraZ